MTSEISLSLLLDMIEDFLGVKEDEAAPTAASVEATGESEE